MNVGEDGYVGSSDIKFARMVSMDEVFTVVGLKREKKKAAKSKVSQSVSDYEQHVNDIEQLLASHQRNWTFIIA